MYQVLFKIPIHFWFINYDLPIYGFGTMLFLSFVCCTWFVTRRAKREGLDTNRIYDMAFLIFICGLIGARVVFMIQYSDQFPDKSLGGLLVGFIQIWNGGIVFYGSAVGGWVGYGLYYLWVRKKYKVPTWRLADIVAPTVCIGLAIGRIGCLLNGCCYGHVCTDHGLSFPTMTAPARELVVDREHYQTPTGFATESLPLGVPTVTGVEPNSPAAKAGVQVGDVIESVNDKPVPTTIALRAMLSPSEWPRGQSSIKLEVRRSGELVKVPAFTPRTLPLHPTQLYETISMFLIFLLLLATLPYRPFYGFLFVLLMVCYAVHRFFNESLRTDTDPVVANLTLSQVGSILVLIAGVALGIYLWRFGERVAPAAKPAMA